MKKILVLLGSIGLTASSFATVISCGAQQAQAEEPKQNSLASLKLDVDFDNNVENNQDWINDQVRQLINELNPLAKITIDYKILPEGIDLLPTGKFNAPGYIKVSATDASKYLTDSFNIRIYKDLDRQIAKVGLVSQGSYDQGVEVKQAIQQMLKDSGLEDKENVYYSFNDDGAGSWSIHSIGNNPIVKVNFVFNQSIGAYNLNNLAGKIADFEVGQKNMSEFKKEVASLINEQVPKAVEWTDYKIIGDPHLGGTAMIIESIDDSQRLTGGFEVQVLKETLNGFVFEHKGLNVLMNENDLDKLIQADFASKFVNFNLVLNIDYEIKITNNLVEVSAIEHSHYVTGSFSFELEKVSLNQFNPVIWNDLTLDSTIDEITTKVLETINDHLKVNGEQRKTVSEADLLPVNFDHPTTLVFSANPNSLIIKGDLIISLTGIDISSITFLPLVVGQQTYDRLEIELVEKINDTLPNWASKITIADLEIDDGTEKLTRAGKITVTPKQTSQLTGSFDIEVLKETLNGFVFEHEDLNVLMNVNDLDKLVQTDFASKFPNLNLVLNTDYEITITNTLVKVSAIDNSNYVTGSFSFELEKISLNQFNPLVLDGLTIDSTVNEITTKALQTINDHLKVDGEQRKTISEIDLEPINFDDPTTLILNASPDSLIIKGDLIISITGIDISTITFPSLIIGQQTYDNLEIEIVEKINDHLPIWASKITIDDLDIDDGTEKLTSVGKIIVTPKQTTQLIGSISIGVIDLIDLSSVTLDNSGGMFKTPRNNVNEFKTLFANAINQLFIDNHLTNEVKFGVDYDLFDADGNVVVDTPTLPYDYPAGQYFIKPIEEGVNYLKNAFEFTITPTDLSKHTFEKEFISGINSIKDIEHEVQVWVNKLAGFEINDEGNFYLTQGKDKDYNIVNNVGNPTDLEKFGSKQIVSLNQKYITNKRTFYVRRYNLASDGFTDENLKQLTTSSSFEDVKTAVEVALKTALGLVKGSLKYGIDFNLSPMETWPTEGVTIISIDAANSYYISGQFNFKLTDPQN